FSLSCYCVFLDLLSFPTRRSSDLVSIGLGLLSKLQVGIALPPAITLICLARFWFLKPRTLREFIILVGTLGMILLWTGLGRLMRSEEHTSELQSRENLVCRLLLEK